MSEHDELLSQFKDITGTTDDNAKFFLELSSWSLQDAISSFYETNVGPETPVRPGAAKGSSVGSNTLAGSTEASSSGSDFKKTFKPKIATLHNMSRESSDEEEEGQAFYAGGSERSGQQVLGSPKRANIRDQLTQMFRLAQDHGSLPELPLEPAPRSTGSTAASGSSSQRSWGVGLRLGQTDTDHSAIVEEPEAGGRRAVHNVILRLWSQGFTVDNGELRHYENPDNKRFLETVINGQLPAELRKMGTQVGVDLEDHRHESYKKPAVVVKTFKGAGNTLGSPQPTVQETKSEEQTEVADDKTNETEAAKSINLNNSEPITSVQIRLSDGSRMAAQFNLSHTIDDIRQYIVIARPQYSTSNFILVTSFPTKELCDGTKTIEESKLQNAVIMQRLK